MDHDSRDPTAKGHAYIRSLPKPAPELGQIANEIAKPARGIKGNLVDIAVDGRFVDWKAFPTT